MENSDKKRKALELIKQTLEVAGLNPDEYDLALYNKARRVPAAPNIQVFQTAAFLAATTLSGSANKIYMYFLSQSGFENYASFDQRTLHENLDMSLSSVEKAIRELTDNGLIIKTDHINDKRRRDYWINPMGAWKGKMAKRKNAIDMANNALDNQLHLFGESVKKNKEREAEEIKQKRPNLFIEMGKKQAGLPNVFDSNKTINVPDNSQEE